MLDKYYQVVLYNLQKFSVPYFVETQLENEFNPQYNQPEKLQQFKEYFMEAKNREDSKIKLFENRIKKSNIVETRDSDQDFSSISSRACIYFQQSYEMFKTSLIMNENSSPLVEYYALVQCIKGALILHYNIIDEVFFFTHHGLNIEKRYQGKPPYVFAEVSSRGIFYGLVLLFCTEKSKGYPKLDDYLLGTFKPVLSEVIKGYRQLDTFTASWMLSNLVRYKPDLWQKLIAGSDDDIINEIRDFRGNHIPKLVEDLLNKFGYLNFIPYKHGTSF